MITNPTDVLKQSSVIAKPALVHITADLGAWIVKFAKIVCANIAKTIKRARTKMDFLKLVSEVGFPIAAALAAGYFVFLTLKFILAGVTGSVNGMGGIIKGLDSRVDTMTNQLQRIDVKVSHALGLQPDYDRISRAEQADQRKD
jgi:hypothetical protein